MGNGGRVSRTLARRTAIVLAASVTVLALATPPAEAARAVERRFVQMVNETRATATLSSLDMSGRLTEIARRHSRRMATQGELYHSNLERLLGPATTSVGENVGYGGSLDQLLDAFLASPPHAHNILGSFERTGVGIVRVDGTYWLTQIFAS